MNRDHFPFGDYHSRISAPAWRGEIVKTRKDLEASSPWIFYHVDFDLQKPGEHWIVYILSSQKFVGEQWWPVEIPDGVD